MSKHTFRITILITVLFAVINFSLTAQQTVFSSNKVTTAEYNEITKQWEQEFTRGFYSTFTFNKNATQLVHESLEFTNYYLLEDRQNNGSGLITYVLILQNGAECLFAVDTEQQSMTYVWTDNAGKVLQAIYYIEFSYIK